MKKAIFALSLFALLLLAGCGGQQPSGQGGTTVAHPETTPTGTSGGTTSTSGGTSTGTSSGGALTAAIAIQNFAFSPATLTVAKGTTVTWTNMDSAPHKLKWAGVESPTLNNGNAFEYKFETAGTYEYACTIHPSMKGTIIVQ